MKNIGVLFLLLVLFSKASLGEQPRQDRYGGSKSFLLDSSKPYVYLEVDHVGLREPVLQGEPTVGLWLRLKNNCTTPIVIVMFKSTPEKSESLVMDEVVPNPPKPKGDNSGSGIIYKAGQEGLTDIFLAPNQHEAEIKGAESVRPGAPHGYNGGQEPGAPMLAVVPPGGAISFSLPINHVSKTWHFEIPFRFALKRSGSIRQPYSYVAFFWEDIPESSRAIKEPSSQGTTLLHESGHVDP